MNKNTDRIDALETKYENLYSREQNTQSRVSKLEDLNFRVRLVELEDKVLRSGAWEKIGRLDGYERDLNYAHDRSQSNEKALGEIGRDVEVLKERVDDLSGDAKKYQHFHTVEVE